MYLSQRVRQLAPSPTLAIDAKAKQMAAQGIDVVNYGVGEPDFDTPQHIKDAGIKAIQSGFTKYTAAAGIPDLRKAIADKLKRENGLDYSPDQIVVSVGGKGGLYNAFLAVCDVGDEVILQAPYWVSYPEIVKLAGGVPVIIETTEKDGFKMTPEVIKAKLTPRTRIINLNSPSNPTGAVYSRKELEAIAEIAVKHDLYVVSDEIYEKMVYDGEEHVSIASFGPEIKKLTVLCNGASKAYAMTGWRLGYVAAEPEITKAITGLQGHQTTNVPSMVQKAGVAAFSTDSDASIKTMVAEFDKRRKFMTKRCNDMPGWYCPEPKGAFYCFPNVSGLFGKTIRGRKVENADTLAEIILAEAHVALVSGSGFGAPNNVRLSYATSMERIETGMDRIEALLKEAK